MYFDGTATSLFLVFFFLILYQTIEEYIHQSILVTTHSFQHLHRSPTSEDEDNLHEGPDKGFQGSHATHKAYTFQPQK